jgi:hypothetical protein
MFVTVSLLMPTVWALKLGYSSFNIAQLTFTWRLAISSAVGAFLHAACCVGAIVVISIMYLQTGE